jgi:hypothetical protein
MALKARIRIMNFLSKLINKTLKVLAWIPVLWEDEDFDYSYLLTIMAFKIRRMRERNEKIQFYEGHEKDALIMKEAEEIIERIKADKYTDNEFYRNMPKAKLQKLELKNYKMREKDLARLAYILTYELEKWWD